MPALGHLSVPARDSAGSGRGRFTLCLALHEGEPENEYGQAEGGDEDGAGAEGSSEGDFVGEDAQSGAQGMRTAERERFVRETTVARRSLGTRWFR